MRRRSAKEKIDLFKLLAMIANDPGIRYGECVSWLKGWFRCGKSAINDSLNVLCDAGCLIRETDETDRRVRRYRVSVRGQQILANPRGAPLLLFARFLFTRLAGRPVASRDLPALQVRFDHAVDLLASNLPAQPAVLADRVSPLGPFEEAAQPVEAEISEPRCKVCRSPLRHEIDLRLASGWSQHAVRKWANGIAGVDAFTANNISRHLHKHFSEHDPRLRDQLDFRIDFEEEQKRLRYAQLHRIVDEGLKAMNAGLIEPQPRDMINAIKVLERLGNNAVDPRAIIAQATAEYELFLRYVDEAWREHGYPKMLDTIKSAFRAAMANYLAEERAAKRRRMLRRPSVMANIG